MKTVAVFIIVCIKWSASVLLSEDGDTDESKCLEVVIPDGDSNDGVVVLADSQSDGYHAGKDRTVVIARVTTDDDRRYTPHVRDVMYLISDLPAGKVLRRVTRTISTKFIALARDASRIRPILDDFWHERILHVIVIHNGTVFTYYPYTDAHCETVGEVIDMGRCTDLTRNPFPDKARNMHGCPLVVTLVERSPSVINNRGEADGVETNLLIAMAEALNATINFFFLKGRLRFYQVNGNSLMRELLENRSHIVAGSLMYTKSTYSVSEGVEYPVDMCVTVAVPRMDRVDLIHTFRSTVPGTLLLGYAISLVIVVTVAFVLLGRNATLRKAVRLILNVSESDPDRVPLRTFLALWLLSSFLQGVIFEASVSSSVLAPKPVHQLETLDDVYDTELIIDGDSFLLKTVMLDFLPAKTRNEYCGCSLKQSLGLIAREADRVYIDVGFNLAYNLRQVPRRVASRVHIQRECIFTFRPVIQLRKNSPFADVLRRFLLSLSESGIVVHAYETYNRRLFQGRGQQLEADAVRPLTLVDFRGCFLVLGLGLGASAVAFIGERLYYTGYRLARRRYKSD